MERAGRSTPGFWESIPAHIALLVIGALIFSLLPKWVSGLPFKHLLSSDAEFYTHAMRVMHQGLSAGQAGIPMDTKPLGDLILNRAIGGLADSSHLDLLGLTVYLSIASLIGFVLAVYALSLVTLRDRGWAFFLAAICIIPVHALGGTTFGFQALGFLPRDFALGLAIGVLVLYALAVQRGSLRWLYATFMACGLCANYYSICFVHLCAVLLCAELIRTRRFSPHLLGFGAIWALSAAPALWDLTSKTGTWAPVDVPIMRRRNGFMIASPLFAALSRYLRRFIIHILMALAGGFLVERFAGREMRERMRPWIAIALASTAIAIFGLILEAKTEYLRAFFSRASLFLTIASMLLTLAGIHALMERWTPSRARLATAIVAGGLFLVQSNLPSVFRYLRDLRTSREQKNRFFTAIEALAAATPPSATILAPSPEMNDIAASLRTYANRRIFVSYKDGGVTLVDGARGRDWLGRYQRQEMALGSRESSALNAFMLAEKIDYAFLPDDSTLARDAAKTGALKTVAHPEGYVILQPAAADSSDN